ncbi:MAG: tripartite tricarboxylate transporter substrate binding protein [Burkholderiales bacterium]|nr:tripartite tricarboxylate transporter substrate binding protein [Burkholderiales bacterium]
MKNGIRAHAHALVATCAIQSVLAFLAFTSVAHAQTAPAVYPTRAVKIIVPFVSGGATDLVARAIAIDMAKTLGQPVVVENKPGNAGAVGADLVAKSPPDGYMLCLCTVGSLITAPLLNPAVPYRTQRDLLPVSLVNTVELGLFARGSLPAANLAEFVALAKASPGRYTYATTGVDGPNYLAFQLFLQRAGIEMLHVPYKGDGQAVVALAAGEVDLFVGGLQSAQPLMKAGRVKALAMTGLQRSKLVPEVPTATETFPGYEHSVWSGVVVPTGTSPAIVAKLQEAIASAVRQPAMQDIFEQNGVVGVGGTPADFAAVIQRDIAKYTEVQKRAGARVN